MAIRLRAKLNTETSIYLITAAVLVGLKLTDVVAWSWWWILAPLWVPVAFDLLVIIALTFGLILKRHKKYHGWY